jgi:transcriptional regulator with XRE-family HTH domain
MITNGCQCEVPGCLVGNCPKVIQATIQELIDSGMSQRDIAVRLDVTPDHLTRVIQGERHLGYTSRVDLQRMVAARVTELDLAAARLRSMQIDPEAVK